MSTRAREGTADHDEAPGPAPAALLAGSWTLAGGLAAGLIVGGFVATGRIHPDILVAVVMAGLGGMLGAVHGAVLGHLGGSAHAGMRGRLAAWALSAVSVAGATVVAVIGSVGLAMSAATARMGSVSGWAMLVAGSLAAGACIVWATVLGWRALESAYMRWPDHRLGSWLALGVFAVLAVVFALLRPVLPGTGLSLSPVGGIVLAGLATLWVALPAIILALPLAHRRAGAG